MKILFTTCLLAVYVSAYSTVHTLCNMPYSPGQYTNFADAQSAASIGDTIYVHGSTLDYGTIFITKPLVIIGTGHNPDKQNPLVSAFLDIIILSSDVQVIGVKVRSIGSSGAINCVIKKCKISADGNIWPMNLFNADNWLIEGNIIESPSPYVCIYFNSTSAMNTIVQNNILRSPNTKIFGLVNTASQRTYILNNVFLGPFAGAGSDAFGDVNYCSVDNNIFYMTNPHGTNFTNSTMDNNISYLGSDDSFYLSGVNNLSGVDPLFVSYPAPQVNFDYSWDFSLQPTSPGLNAGTDGMDLGVYGGLGFRFTMTGEPSIAEITNFTITSPTIIAPGGNLTISVTSKRVH